MELFEKIKQQFSPSSQSKTLHTQRGNYNMAKEDDRKKLNRVVIELQRETDALTRKDLGDWRNAWQLAINIDNPDRRLLYDIYKDVEIDLHLSGCIEQRKGAVRSRSFKLTDNKHKDRNELLDYFEKPWFKNLISYIIDSKYWGHSLIELGDVITDENGNKTYDGVYLIPRKHVIPEYHIVTPTVFEDWRSGYDYKSEPFNSWLIEAGQPDDLGKFLKAAVQTIPKKNMLAFWDTFGEIFGMPMRVAKTSTRDPKEMAKLQGMMKDSGANLYMITGLDTEIEFIESKNGDAFNVYDKRIERANSELSKLIIGQTMTIEDGSSLSQSETHLKVFENLVEDDCDFIRDIVNYQLIPRMIKHGFPLKGIRFDWDYSTDYTPEQQMAYEEMIMSRYDVDPKYFEEKYNIPCKAKEMQAGNEQGLVKPVNPSLNFFD